MKKSLSIETIISLFIFFFSILFLSPDALALDPAKALNEYLIKTWGVESGLPQNTVNDLVQTRDGFIWIGTSAGLVRFDGVRFKVFSRSNTPALKNDRILALDEDKNGVLWIGTDGGGLCSFKNGAWTNFTSDNGLSNNHVRAISSDLQNNLWIGTEYGLNRLSSDGFHLYTTRDGLYDNIITALAVDYSGNLWIGTMRGGLAQFKDRVTHVYDYQDGLLNTAVLSLSASRMGNIWIGTLEGLYSLEREKETVDSYPGTTYTPITAILEDEQGALWVGTMSDGLKRMTGRSMRGLSSKDGFPDDFIHSFFEDRDGNLWVGTDTAGLVELKEAAVGNIARNNGLPENTVHAVLEDDEGSLWVGTRNSGLCRMRNDRVVEIIDKKSGLSSNRTRVLFKDNAGGLWIGTEGNGVNILRKGKITLLTTEDGLPSDYVTAVLQDRAGTLWIGTESGIVRFSGGRIRMGDSSTGLINQHIRVLLESREGVLYVGTKQGLYKFSGQSFELIDDKSADSKLDVISLYEDKEGILWIGTNGRGLSRWFDGKMTSWTTKEGLVDNYIFSINEDNSGNLWMSTSKGVSRVSRKELSDFSEQKIPSVHSTYYDEADGMASRQCIGWGQPSSWKTRSGRIYFPTAKGLAVFDTENMAVKSKPPQAAVEEVFADNRPIIDQEKNAFSHKVRVIEFHFTGLDFSAPDKIRFRCKLEGFDHDFIDVLPGDRRVASYAGLNPGKYSFLVRAVNNDGLWNEQDGAFEFEILTPVYSRPLFYLILLLAALFISAGGVLVRYQKNFRKRLEKYKTSALHPEKVEEVVPNLLRLMEEERLFLDPDLTLRDLSQRLRIHYNHLSRIINERFGLSYNDFINRYRIEEAKQKLTDEKQRESTILDILLSTGFYSKSVFNTAFKKFTGITPSEYRKKHLQ